MTRSIPKISSTSGLVMGEMWTATDLGLSTVSASWCLRASSAAESHRGRVGVRSLANAERGARFWGALPGLAAPALREAKLALKAPPGAPR